SKDARTGARLMPPSVDPPLRLGERGGSGSESSPNDGLSWRYLRRSRPRARSHAPVQPASWRWVWATSGANGAKQQRFRPPTRNYGGLCKGEGRGGSRGKGLRTPLGGLDRRRV